MKILLINGNPRGKRSNTYKLSQAFVKGLSGNGQPEYEEIIEKTEILKPVWAVFPAGTKLPVNVS